MDVQKAHRMAGYAQALAGKTEMLLGCGLYGNSVNGTIQSAGDIFSHLIYIRGKFRFLADDCNIYVFNGCACGGNYFANLSCKFKAVCAFVLFVGVREMLAYIPQGQSSQKAVHYGV